MSFWSSLPFVDDEEVTVITSTPAPDGVVSTTSGSVILPGTLEEVVTKLQDEVASMEGGYIALGVVAVLVVLGLLMWCCWERVKGCLVCLPLACLACGGWVALRLWALLKAVGRCLLATLCAPCIFIAARECCAVPTWPEDTTSADVERGLPARRRGDPALPRLPVSVASDGYLRPYTSGASSHTYASIGGSDWEDGSSYVPMGPGPSAPPASEVAAVEVHASDPQVGNIGEENSGY